MASERETIMEKARSRRQRRTDTESTGKTAHRKGEAAKPDATLTEKVVDFAQDAAAQVGSLVKAAAHKVSGTKATPTPKTKRG